MQVKRTEYDLLPAQYEFFHPDRELIKKANEAGKIYQDITLYQGGFGSGKTFVGSLRGLCLALMYPGLRGLVAAYTQDLLDNTTKRKYLEHMENIGLKEGDHWWFKDRQQIIEFKNGSVIRFKTVSDWESLRSEEFGFIEFEEASLIQRGAFLELIGRLRQQKKPEWGDEFYRTFFLHTNPGGKRGWLNEYFINPKTRKPKYRYVTASTRENHHLGDEYVETLEELYSADQVKEMVEGIDADSDNKVAFPDFDENNIIENLPYNPDKKLILTCDFNYNPMCWYLCQEDNGNWSYIRELVKQNTTTKQMCEWIQPIVSEYNTKDLVIMGDSHGRDKKTNGSDYSVMINHFTNAGFNVTLRVQKANPPIKDRLAVLRGHIRNSKGVRKIKVDSKCKWLIYNFENCQNNLSNGALHLPTDNEIQRDDTMRFLIHPIDAISYPIYYVQKLRDTSGDESIGI